MLKIKELILPQFHTIKVTVPFEETNGNSIQIAFRGAPGQEPGSPPRIDWNIWQGSNGYTEKQTEDFAVAATVAVFLVQSGSVENAIALIDTGVLKKLPNHHEAVTEALRAAEVVRE